MVRLQGGLGNQLFQYATGFCIARQSSRRLFLDLSLLEARNDPGITPRSFALDRFPISGEIVAPQDARRFRIPRPGWSTRLTRRGLPFPGRHYVFERSKICDTSQFRTRDKFLLLDGFWQSEGYFQSCRAVLLQELRSPPVPAEFHKKAAVSVHVRRGDYVSNPLATAFHGVCDFGYYRRAFAAIESRVADPFYYLFTDDPEWVSANSDAFARKFTLVSDGSLSAHEELARMSACQHHLLANSSFSWWGAWLGAQDPDVVIVAPAAWFRQETLAPDLLPERWTQV